MTLDIGVSLMIIVTTTAFKCYGPVSLPALVTAWSLACSRHLELNN